MSCRRRTPRTDAQQLADRLDQLPSGRVVFDEHGHAWQNAVIGDTTYWYRAYDAPEPVSSFRLAQYSATVTTEPRRH